MSMNFSVTMMHELGAENDIRLTFQLRHTESWSGFFPVGLMSCSNDLVQAPLCFTGHKILICLKYPGLYIVSALFRCFFFCTRIDTPQAARVTGLKITLCTRENSGVLKDQSKVFVTEVLFPLCFFFNDLNILHHFMLHTFEGCVLTLTRNVNLLKVAPHISVAPVPLLSAINCISSNREDSTGRLHHSVPANYVFFLMWLKLEAIYCTWKKVIKTFKSFYCCCADAE